MRVGARESQHLKQGPDKPSLVRIPMFYGSPDGRLGLFSADTTQPWDRWMGVILC